jgi:hypothetical protein
MSGPLYVRQDGVWLSVGTTGQVEAASYEQYRLLIEANNGSSSWHNVASLELRPTVGGADAAPGAGGTASASNQQSSTFNAAKAFDGNINTRWLTANTSEPEWLRYDFGAAQEVAEYAIHVEQSADEAPKDWKFQGSDDGSTWEDLDTQTDQTISAGVTAVYPL